jgi:hypothetical protein
MIKTGKPPKCSHVTKKYSYFPGLKRAAGRPQVTSPVLTARDKDLLAEALRLKSALGDEVWPGLGAEAIPVILYNDAYEFLTGMQDPPPPSIS